MKAKLRLSYDDVDENMHTVGEASITMDIEADDYTTMYELGMKMQKLLQADYFDLSETE